MSVVYYLHENGDLICKPMDNIADIRESDFAKGLWFLDETDRESAWSLVVEAKSAGTNGERIDELAEKWGLTDADAHNYCDRLNLVVEMDGNAWCVHHINFQNLQESPAGFGETILEALSEFCRELGFKPTKMWGASFKDLLTAFDGDWETEDRTESV